MNKFRHDKLTLPMFKPECSWRPPALGDLPSWAGASRVAVDVETCDPDLKTMGIGVRRGGYIVGVGFAIEDGPYAYLPIRHAGGDNLDPEKVIAYLHDQAKHFTGDIVGAYLPYDIDYLAEVGVEFHPRRFRDVQVAEPLLDEHQMSYSLEAIAARHGLPGKDETMLQAAAAAYHFDAKSDLWRLPGRYVGAYGEQDTRLPLQLLRRQERKIDEQGLNDIYDLECRVLPVLVKMRRRGVKINFETLEKIEARCLEEEIKALRIIKDETCISIDVDEINAKGKVAQAMGVAHLTFDRTPTGQPKIDAAMLKSLGKHPVAQAIIAAKQFNKIRTTFARSIRRYATNGRVHCTFNQLRSQRDNGDLVGVGPGRLSCVHPNLQQQPSKGWIGKLWRSIYEADEGGEWAAIDLASQEPRMAVHYAYISKCPGSEIAWQMYQDNPRTDFHGMTTGLAFPALAGHTEEDPEFAAKRKQCKVVFLGLIYGMGGAKLCRSLNYPIVWKEIRGGMREVAGPEGQLFLDGFHQMVPWLRALVQKIQKAAKAKGYIRTILGRHCHLKEAGDERKSPNNLIQGSSAEQLKASLVMLDEEGITPQLSVHDENDLTIYSREEAHRVAYIMTHSLPQLTVPSVCDIEVGKNWGDSMGKKT